MHLIKKTQPDHIYNFSAQSNVGLSFEFPIETYKSIVDVTAEYCAKINSLIIANVDGTNAADITVEISIDNGSNYFAIAKTISVPADSSLSLIGKDNGFYLDETDLLAVTASANSDLTAMVSYELMKDA